VRTVHCDMVQNCVTVNTEAFLVLLLI